MTTWQAMAIDELHQAASAMGARIQLKEDGFFTDFIETEMMNGRMSDDDGQSYYDAALDYLLFHEADIQSGPDIDDTPPAVCCPRCGREMAVDDSICDCDEHGGYDA